MDRVGSPRAQGPKFATKTTCRQAKSSEKQSGIQKQQTQGGGREAPAPLGCHRRRHFVVFIISDCFSDDFACRHAVFLVNFGPWALEQSDLTQSVGSGLKKTPTQGPTWSQQTPNIGLKKRSQRLRKQDQNIFRTPKPKSRGPGPCI